MARMQLCLPTPLLFSIAPKHYSRGVFDPDPYVLLRFVELARGENDRVRVIPQEVIRDAPWWHAEQVPCVRSDPLRDHQPIAHDIEDARRVKRALDLLDLPLLNYVIADESITSLVHRRIT